MAAEKLEQRVAALEAEVAALKHKVNGKKEVPWWEAIAGTFADDPDYLKAMELGRKYRESTRAKPSTKRKPRHVGS